MTHQYIYKTTLTVVQGMVPSDIHLHQYHIIIGQTYLSPSYTYSQKHLPSLSGYPPFLRDVGEEE